MYFFFFFLQISATCDNDPCLNGGTCSDDPSGSDSFTCACVPGYEDDARCAYETDYCAPITCQNGATCVSDRTSLTYDCQCVTGYTGILCETNIDDCQPNSCLNGAPCVDGVNEFMCDCLAGKLFFNVPLSASLCHSLVLSHFLHPLSFSKIDG